tara:strand:- start:1644 stop:2213 length:570 start_codon:yes stop_codon:yes gene_type:complete
MKNRIIQGDLTKGDLNNLMEGKKADVIYTDPPWDDSWVKIFRKRANYDSEGHNINKFLQVFIKEIKKHSKGIIYIEMGVKSIDLLQKLLKEENFTKLNKWEYPLNKGVQYLIRGYFIKPNNVPIIPNNLKLTDKKIKDIVEVDKVDGGILLDPCIGIGRTYDIAKYIGMDCFGLEIQQNKVDKLNDRIK